MPLKQTNLCEFCNFLNWSFNFVDGSHWHYDKLFLKWFSFLPFMTSPRDDSKAYTFEQNEHREKRKQQILAVSIAMTAMILYAFSIGFIKIDVIKHTLEYNRVD